MKFENTSNYKKIKYIIKVECTIISGQKMVKEEKTFYNIDRAMSYILTKKDEIKKYPELYPNVNIFMEKIKTESNTFRVLEGD